MKKIIIILCLLCVCEAGYATTPEQRDTVISNAFQTAVTAGTNFTVSVSNAIQSYITSMTNTLNTTAFLSLTNATSQILTTTNVAVTNFNISEVAGTGVSASNAAGVIVMPAGRYSIYVSASFKNSAGASDDVIMEICTNSVGVSQRIALHRSVSTSEGVGSMGGPLTLSGSTPINLCAMVTAGSTTITFEHIQFWIQRIY